MLSEENKKKLSTSYDLISNTGGKIRLGMVVICETDVVSDVISHYPDSNKTAFFEIGFGTEVEDFLDQLITTLLDEKMVFVKITDFLNPKVYNQFYLYNREGRMEFIDTKGEMKSVEIPKNANIILIMTEKDFDDLNYKNIHDLVGDFVRLE